MPARRTRENKHVEDEYGRKSSGRAVKLEEPEDDHDEGGETQPFRQDFYNSVYRTVRLIPEGKVASYGTIGKLIGHPRHSRMVGAALKCLPPSMSSPYLPPAPRSASGESTASTSSSLSSSSHLFSMNPHTSNNDDLFDFVNGEGIFDFDINPTASSLVGSSQEEEEYVIPAPLPNPDWVPWHRVVSSTGIISPRGNDRAVQRQADYLIAEGIEVKDGIRNGGGGAGSRPGVGGVDAFGLGGASGGRVSMALYGWKG